MNRIDFPEDGRTPADLIESILMYLPWQKSHGRPISRGRGLPEWGERTDAIRAVLTAWNRIVPSASGEYDHLPAALMLWPEADRARLEVSMAPRKPVGSVRPFKIERKRA